MKKATFFDRDGVIVKPIKGEAPQKPQELTLIPEVVKVIKETKNAGFINIIVSNQPDIALGEISEETKLALEKKFEQLIKKYNLPIDAIYYCFHHPKGIIKKYAKICSCRKPNPGMLLEAAKNLGIDLANSWMVGDRASDIKAGENAGVRTILFDPNNSQEKYLVENDAHPDYTVKKLSGIIPIICKQ